MPPRVVDAVRTRRAFLALGQSRSRSRSGPVGVVRATAPEGSPEAGGAPVRVAYAIGRTVGGAVVRNRLRRRLRAMIVEVATAGAVPPGLYLVGATAAAVAEPSDRLRDHLARAVGGAAA